MKPTRIHSRKSLILAHLLAFFLIHLNLPAQVALTPEVLSQKIDKIFEKWNNSNSPGASVAIDIDGERAFEKAYGMADIEQDIPIDLDNTLFYSASLTKQFTAFAVLLLADEGKLNISQRVSQYFPNFTSKTSVVTIEHLLTHTSGWRGYGRLMQMAGWRLDDVFDPTQVHTILQKQRTLNFEPGEEFEYCNSGYFLLARIVEKVSGQTFPEFIKERILNPLGMNRSFIRKSHTQIIAHFADSYELFSEEYGKSPNGSSANGDSGLITCVDDMMKWAANFKSCTVGNKAIFKQMEQETILPNGKRTWAGKGLFIDTYYDRRMYYHTGSTAGYRALFLRIPEEKYSLILLSNTGDLNRWGVVNQLNELFLPPTVEEEDENPPSEEEPLEIFDSEEKTLRKYCGEYWQKDDQYLRRIALKDGQLFYQREVDNETRLIPISENEFRMQGSGNRVKVKFTPLDSSAYQMNVSIGSNKIAFAPTPKNVDDDIAGKYYSDELATEYSVTINIEGEVTLAHLRLGKFDLKSVAQDKLFSPESFLGNISFLRDETGRVTKMSISNNRVRNMLFDKK